MPMTAFRWFFMYVRWEFPWLRTTGSGTGTQPKTFGRWRKKLGLEIGHLAALVTEGSEGLPPAGYDGVFTKMTFGNLSYLILPHY
jgi:hypothetical protein